MYGSMKKAVGMEEDDPDLLSLAGGMVVPELPNWFKLDDESELDPPPFALLLGGMFAPAQLKMTRGNCNSQIVWNSVILATCTACFIMDAHHGCPDKMVWIWIYGMLFINILDVLCCAFIAARCATAIGEIQDDEDSMSRIRKTGNSIWDMYIALQANSGQFFKAYFAYQGIIDSPIYTFQKLMAFLGTIWGCVGMWITIEDIVEDTLTCDAKIILWFLHTYSWFFLLFLTWTLLSIVLWLLQKLSGFTFVTAPIMDEAKLADEEVPFKMPLFQTLARSFLLRDSSTMLHIKARQVERDVSSLEQEIEDTKQKLTYRKTYLDQLESRRTAAAANEKKLIDKYKDKVRAEGGTLPDDAPPVVPLGESGSASSSAGAEGASSSNVFAGALQQAESFASQQHEAGWDATMSSGLGYASSAQEAARSAMASPGAQSYLQQAQDAAASAQTAASSAAASAQDAANGAMATAQAPQTPAGISPDSVDVSSMAGPEATGSSSAPTASRIEQAAETPASTSQPDGGTNASGSATADAEPDSW